MLKLFAYQLFKSYDMGLYFVLKNKTIRKRVQIDIFLIKNNAFFGSVFAYFFLIN